MQGIDSTLISGRGDNEAQQQLLTLPQSKTRHYANVLSFRLTQVEAPFNHGAWKKLLDTQLPSTDLIHLHNAHGYYLPHEVLKQLLNKPTVWTLHDNWLLSGRCGFSHACRGYESGCASCPHKNYYPKTWVDHAKEEFQKRKALPLEHCRLVTPSQVQKNQFTNAGFSSDSISVIPNPVSLSETPASAAELSSYAKQLGLAPHKKTLLFVAENIEDPRKGFTTLKQALKLLKQPEQYQLLLVGHCKTIPALPLDVCPTGLIKNRKQMSQLFALSDITIIPSLEESFGLIGPEALSAGSRVVCNDLEVFKETLQNYATYVEANDPALYAEAIENLSKIKHRAGPPKTMPWYPEQAFKNYLHLYQEMLPPE